MYMGASDMRLLSGWGVTKRAVPFHRIVDVLDISVIDVLPAIHALSAMLISFGKEPLTWDFIEAAEQLFVGSISNKSGGEIFDELSYKLYHSNSVKFGLEKLPPTSTSIEKHNKRAYY